MADQTNRKLWLEVSAVLVVVLLAEYYSILASLILPRLGESSVGFSTSPGDFLWEIIKHSALSALLLYLIWRTGEPWHRFGFTRPSWMTLDTNIAMGVLFVNYVVVSGVSLLLLGPGHSGHFGNDLGDSTTSPGAVHLIVEELLFIIDTWVGAFYEELLMRGYLIPRFEQLFHSTWASLLLTAFLFGGFHMEQGTAVVLNTMLAGLVYGGAFCLFRRLWPIVAAHAFYNLAASVLPWL